MSSLNHSLLSLFFLFPLNVRYVSHLPCLYVSALIYNPPWGNLANTEELSLYSHFMVNSKINLSQIFVWVRLFNTTVSWNLAINMCYWSVTQLTQFQITKCNKMDSSNSGLIPMNVPFYSGWNFSLYTLDQNICFNVLESYKGIILFQDFIMILRQFSLPELVNFTAWAWGRSFGSSFGLV